MLLVPPERVDAQLEEVDLGVVGGVGLAAVAVLAVFALALAAHALDHGLVVVADVDVTGLKRNE